MKIRKRRIDRNWWIVSVDSDKLQVHYDEHVYGRKKARQRARELRRRFK